MNGIKANARKRIEQDVDLVLKNMKLKILSQPYDEVLMMKDSRYKNYKANEEFAWRIWQTPRTFQNNNCLQEKKIFSKNGGTNQAVGHVM